MVVPMKLLYTTCCRFINGPTKEKVRNHKSFHSDKHLFQIQNTELNKIVFKVASCFVLVSSQSNSWYHLLCEILA